MDLQTLQTKKILMLGKPRAFSHEELFSQLQHHNITLQDEYTPDVEMLIEGRMMTPYEQNLSDELYEEKKLPSLSIDVFEKLLAEELDNDTLLMSLKLSHDKERLKSFLQNGCISDALFFKLLKMYSWGGEDFFENDDNRDVSAAFIGRFYENIERNHNVQYATTGFIHLVAQTDKRDVLEAIAELEPLQYHPKIMMAIALSPLCDAKLQKKLHKKRDEFIDEALSCNKNLDAKLVEEFLEEAILAKNIAKHHMMDWVLFEKLQSYSVELAHNPSLTKEMQERILNSDEIEVLIALSGNSSLDATLVEQLLARDDESIDEALYKNAAMPKEMLLQAYDAGQYLASLAQNENTPVEILYQLQLDSRYERYVKTNSAFGAHIQSENIGWLV